jgi:hypothetical protein
MTTTPSRTIDAEFGGRAANTLLAIILVGVGIRSILCACEKPLWFDEILTIIMCRVPSVSKLWQALNNGADTNPPLFYLIAGFAHRFIADDHVAYRLPSIVGLLVTIVCIYLFLSRRIDRLSSLVGATFLLCTQLVFYSTEARPYGLMIGFVSVAILAWQRTDKSQFYSVALCIALAIALSLHYYAILVWPAFALSEATVYLSRRRLRIGTWIAFVVATAPMFLFAPLLVHLREYYGRNFWSRPSIGQIYSAPGNLYNFLNYWIYCLTVGMIVVLVCSSLGKTLTFFSSRQRDGDEPALPIEECVLIGVLLLLPVIAVIAAKVGGGGMTYRYMLPMVLGAALALGFIATRLSQNVRAVLLTLILVNYSLSSLSVMKRTLTGSLLARRNAIANQDKAIVADYRKFALPIVIEPGSNYLPMVYYMPADQKVGLYALADPKAAMTFFGSDSVDLALLALRPYYPLQVENYGTFASSNHEFILVSVQRTRRDWWPARLLRDGDTLNLVAASKSVQAYKVTLNSQPMPNKESPDSGVGGTSDSESPADEVSR